MISTLSPAPSVLDIHPFAVAAEHDLETIFLGDDLEATCIFAARFGDPVIFASAALPLKNRKEAVAHWRKKQFRAILVGNPDFRRFLEGSPVELREAITEGKISQAEIAAQVAEFKEAADNKRWEILNASKADLRQAMRAALKDCDSEGGGGRAGLAGLVGDSRQRRSGNFPPPPGLYRMGAGFASPLLPWSA